MRTVQPWMRLKVKGDTFFLPTPDGSVYFRNNMSSFRMEGTSILDWIEQLLPAFDGQQSMESLTEGLPEDYSDRIYDIASILYDNDFVRDVSTDQAHRLTPVLLDTYRAQIEFLDNLSGSGAHRFDQYRNANLLLVGSGHILHHVKRALAESGADHVHVVDGIAPDTFDIAERMDAVLYVSDSGDIDAARQLDAVCHASQIPLFCAVVIDSVGFVPPCDSVTGLRVPFTSVWRRVHSTVLNHELDISGFTEVATAVLAHVFVFEVFKTVSGVESGVSPRLYVLDGETLEGKWHSVTPFQEVTNTASRHNVGNLRDRLTNEDDAAHGVAEDLAHLAELTSPVTGIFHVWDEDDLLQVPLAQCRVQPIDPLSEGPATLLPETSRAALTHDDARREAGLTGLEAYMTRLLSEQLGGDKRRLEVGIGVGFTLKEAVGRSVQHALVMELKQGVRDASYTVHPIQLGQVEDDLCQFCLRSLEVVGRSPVIWRGADILGLPVLWVELGDTFVGTVDLSMTTALQRVLTHALLLESGCPTTAEEDVVVTVSTSLIRGEPDAEPQDIEPCEGVSTGLVISSLDTLVSHGARFEVMNFTVEPAPQDVLADVLVVTVVRGES